MIPPSGVNRATRTVSVYEKRHVNTTMLRRCLRARPCEEPPDHGPLTIYHVSCYDHDGAGLASMRLFLCPASIECPVSLPERLCPCLR